MDRSLLDLERCSFLRPLDQGGASGSDPLAELCCWAAGRPKEVAVDEQRRRCSTVRHTGCPALVAALDSPGPDGWAASGRAARIVAEACHLAQARLEVRAEALGPVLSRIFGSGT